MVEKAEIVVIDPSPINLYQTPFPPTQELGAVSTTEPRVVPGKAEVPQGSDVAAEQSSLGGSGGVVTQIVNVPWPVPES